MNGIRSRTKLSRGPLENWSARPRSNVDRRRYWFCRVVVVVVDETTGGGVVEVVCSVVVVLVTLSELPQAVTKAVPASSAPTVKIRRRDVVLIMEGLRCKGFENSSRVVGWTDPPERPGTIATLQGEWIAPRPPTT